MLNNRTLLVLFFLVAGVVSATSQKTSYGRFGYGELMSPSFSAGRAMGGVGYGVRNSKSINPLNPASYSSVDSLSFLFDIGAHVNTAWFKEGENQSTTLDGNIDYLGLEFRLFKGMGLSLGMIPFSSVAYSFGSENTNAAGGQESSKYTGKGGFNRLYFGLGYNLFKNFSLGANASYFFGNTVYETTRLLGGDTYGNSKVQKLRISSVLLDLGAQYTIPWKNNNEITLGLSYTPKMALNGTFYKQEKVGATLVQDSTIRSLGFDYPQSIGGGLSYAKKRKYMIAADVLYQQWEDTRFFDGDAGEWDGAGALLQDRYRYALGGEYIPNATGRNYMGRVRYRAGTHYSNSYFKIKGDGASYDGTKEFGVSAGFGFPMLDNRSSIDLTFDYVSVLPDRKDFIKEQYFKITISYTMNELWFVKRRLD